MKLSLVFSLLCVGLCMARSRKKTSCPADSSSCSECIAEGKHCVWCSSEDYSGSRCQSEHEMMTTGRCQFSDVVNPSEKMVPTKNKKIRGKRIIKPQKMSLALRKGATTTLPVQVLAKKSSLSLQLKGPRAVKVMVSSDCNGFQHKKKTVLCRGIQPGVITFNFTMTLKRCLPKTKKVKVLVDGKKKKALKMSITSLCSCDCDKPDQRVPDSPLCRSSGDFACGQCSCDSGFYGKRCECSGNPAESITRCTAVNSTTPCSGRGECVCGSCHCFAMSSDTARRYSGQYCECDDYSCAYFNSQICGGPDHGRCLCGHCMCTPGYTGPDCGFSLATDRCVATNGRICNDHGSCISNRCVCEGSFLGPTCEECPTCPGKCELHKPCVQCTAFASGLYSQEECANNCRTSRVQYRLADSISDNYGSRMCRFRDDDDCLFYFSYNYDDAGRQVVLIQRTMTCPSP